MATEPGLAVGTLLIVEDDRVINDGLSARLRAEGFTVAQAYDGPGGVAAFEQEQPDLVALDVMLPGFDGNEVCRHIQALRPVPVLMLTARDDESDVLVGLTVGADDYVTKPFRVREVVARIRALLRRVERARELAQEGSPRGSCSGPSPSTPRPAASGRGYRGAPLAPRVRPPPHLRHRARRRPHP